MNNKEKRRTTVFFPKELYRKIKIISAYKDNTVTDCIVEACKKYVKENEKLLKKQL